jgi:hypothetical protein
MPDTADNNFDDESEAGRPDQTTPRTPWLLWLVVFVIVVLMVVWSIRKFGTRSSAAADTDVRHLPAPARAML